MFGPRTLPRTGQKRQYLFPHRVNERDFCQIYDQLHSVMAARHERTSVLCGLGSESALKLKAQGVRGILYVHA